MWNSPHSFQPMAPVPPTRRSKTAVSPNHSEMRAGSVIAAQTAERCALMWTVRVTMSSLMQDMLAETRSMCNPWVAVSGAVVAPSTLKYGNGAVSFHLSLQTNLDTSLAHVHD